MITDNRSQPNFRILTYNHKQLTFFGEKYGKLIYRQYHGVPKQNQEKLLKWLHFSHPYLLAVHKIQRILDHDEEINLGVYCEHFVGSLENYFAESGFSYDQQQIVNTFQPVLQAIEYLHSQNFPMAPVKLRNVVITQNQQVKLLDESLIDPIKVQKVLSQPSDIFKIYEELSTLIFDLLVPELKGKSSKSWKNRLQILQNRTNKQTYTFFISIFNKSLLNSQSPKKSKKILKAKKERRALQGKQNHIIQ